MDFLALCFTVRRCHDIDLMEWLNDELFPNDDFEGIEVGNRFWVARSLPSKTAVGFCSVRPSRDGVGAFLSRAGVLEPARGQGLHKRMIQVRCRWAHSKGYPYILTYCLKSNEPSAISLQHAGFSLYAPLWRWAGEECFYWRRDLK